MAQPRHHKRVNEYLLSYWSDQCRGRVFPCEEDIDQEVLHEIWDSCFLVQVCRDGAPTSFRYGYLGTSLLEAFGGDLTGEYIARNMMDPSAPPLLDKLKEVAARPKPQVEENEFTNPLGLLVKYRCCLLPLGKNPPQVDYILGGMRWRVY